MYSPAEQAMIREDIFRWLDEKLGSGINELTRAELVNYHFGDVRIPLVDQGRGIRNPGSFDATLSILTSVAGPYTDLADGDGLIHYNYQSRDGGDNLKLARAIELQTPLIYFQGIRPGVYVPVYPVYVVADDTVNRSFAIALDESMRFFGDPLHMIGDQRRYAERTVGQRLHQPVFRARVLHAYNRACTVCRPKHPDLLDAAHILPDSTEAGVAVVTNGLALCKIHRAAYDRNLIAVSRRTITCASTVTCSTKSTSRCCGAGCKTCMASQSRCRNGDRNGRRVKLSRCDSTNSSDEATRGRSSGVLARRRRWHPA